MSHYTPPTPDPFDRCAECGHSRRAHDSGGCGKWIEMHLTLMWDTRQKWHDSTTGITCPCAKFSTQHGNSDCPATP